MLCSDAYFTRCNEVDIVWNLPGKCNDIAFLVGLADHVRHHPLYKNRVRRVARRVIVEEESEQPDLLFKDALYEPFLNVR